MYGVKNLSRTAEDYLEAILNVTLEKGYARTKDVAHEPDLSHSSVVLKPAGREVAEVVRSRHEILREFLRVIHVPETIADADACAMEHELHPATIQQIRLLVEVLRSGSGITGRHTPAREESAA